MTEPRIPPQSLEAEQAILGHLLTDNAAWHRVSNLISENDFYLVIHQRIYHQISRLLENGQAATADAVALAMKAAGDTDRAKGFAYLEELVAGAPSTDAIPEQAATITDKSILRQLLKTTDSIAADALDPGGRLAEDVITEAEARIAKLAASCNGHHDNFMLHINPLLTREVERIQDLHDQEHKPDAAGVPSGFPALDSMTRGFRRGDLIVLAGRPAIGKTALALDIARHVGLAKSLPVLIFSLDDGDGQWTRRLLASVGQLDLGHLQSGNLSEQDWSRLSYALGMLHEAPIFICESEVLPRHRLGSLAKHFCRLYGGRPGLIVVDFIQRMAAQGNSSGGSQDMVEICRSLKALAKELDVPIIALSRLPGSVEQRIDKRPMLSDLMDYGPIEEVADLILLLYRDEYYRADSSERGVVELFIGHQRNGPTGRVRLAFKQDQAGLADLP